MAQCFEIARGQWEWPFGCLRFKRNKSRDVGYLRQSSVCSRHLQVLPSVSGCTPQTVLISVDNTSRATGGFGAAISEDGHFAVFQSITGGVQRIMLAATGF